MDKLVCKEQMSVSFYDCIEKDFFICTMGYNDLHFIEPIKVARQQSSYTIHIVLNGRGTLHIGRNTYRVKEHSLFFIPPNVSICYYPDEDNAWDYVWFEFFGENAEKYAEKMGLCKEKPVAVSKNFAATHFELRNIFARLERGGSVGYYDVMAAFYRILDINSADRSTETENLDEIINAYLECHYHTPSLTVEGMCRALNVSHSHLCRVYKQKNGYTIIKQLVHIRVREACRLLECSSLSVKEIAYSVGFRDEVHFMKVFKKYIGMSAAEYRKKSAE